MSSDLSPILRSIYKELERLEKELDETRKNLLGAISAVYAKLEGYIARIGEEVERTEEYIRNLNARIEEVREELESEINETRERIEEIRNELMSEINKTKEYLEQRIEEVREELESEINATRVYLEGKIAETEQRLGARIRETEQRLDQHLAEQDKVLEIHGEGLLGSAVMQLIGVLMPRLTPSTHVVVGQFNSYPLIVVEDEDRVNLICVVKEENRDVAEQMKRLAHLIRRYTGKDVDVGIYAMKPKEGAPLWLTRLALAEATQLAEKK